jgi:hypothetical protein
VDLAKLGAGQADLEKAVDDWRKGHLRYEPGFIPQDATLPAMPRFGRLLLDGIEFRCRDAAGPAHPLLVGKGCEEVTIPVGRRVSALAALGHVAIQGGYPSSTIFSVHHRDAEVAKGFGTPAAEYRFEFEDGEVTVPLRHGMEILRSNDVCRWWTPGARAPETRPAVRVAINKTFEVLRLDLWEHTLAKPRFLKAIRWRLADPEAILLLYGLSVRVAT